MILSVRFPRPLVLAAAALSLAASACAQVLRVEVGQTRSRSAIHEMTDEAVREFARRTALLGRSKFELLEKTGRLRTPFTLPVRVVLTQNGVPLPSNPGGRANGTGIVPTFDTSPPFPAAYQTLLEDTFTQARPAMDAIFGSPSTGGVVHVSNYDASIQDRYAVAGGYYVTNGGPNGEPEIRFPVYISPVSTAINYVHCLLLAYQGPSPYPFDAFQEGLVRAATMRVARTANSIPGSPTSAEIEATLDSLYDVGAFYDWYNQPALGCAKFIAPNLLNTQLPTGGSTGGIFLLRYQMAGTAWYKVLTEHPGFIAEFNTRYYASPGAYTTNAALTNLGQQVLDFLVGGTGSVEGMSFADWTERQYILDTQTTAGMKVMVQPFPIQAVGGTSDFGVFAVDVNAFRTAANGDESLLAGTSYPVYWRPDFSRFFTSPQDDQIRFSGAYGSVVPNFPGATFGNEPYRVVLDVPFGGANQRVVLPAGAYSTGTNPNPRNFIGTLTGLPVLTSGTYQVSVEWPGGSVAPFDADNFAFGAAIADPDFLDAQPVTVRVYSNDGAPTELFSLRVNKGLGMLALDIAPPSADATYNFTTDPALALLGVPLQPYRVRPTDVFGTTEGQTLYARWNPTFARYDLFPDAGQVMAGLGFFLRAPASAPLAVRGYSPPRTPQAVSLLPGWNIVAVPFDQTLSTSNVSFTVATEAVSSYSQSLGTIIGNTVFEFQPDGLNPDLGTMVPATTFEPGKGYYVRALRPEGAVMVFTPTDFPFWSGGGGIDDSVRSAWGGTYPERRWEVRVDVYNRRHKVTTVVVGQSTRTRRGFDPLYDSELPPTPGGYQAAILADRPMYKDIGVMGDRERFRIRVTGLYPGERCSIDVSSVVGNQTVTLRDTATGRTRTMSGGSGRYFFNAAGTSQTFEIVPGGRA